MVLLLQVYISTGDLVGTKLKQPQIDGIISGIRSDLRNGKYGKAMETTVIQVGLTLSGNIDPSDGSDESSFDWGLGFFLSIVAGFFGLSAWTGYRQKRQQQNVRTQLRGMQRDVKVCTPEQLTSHAATGHQARPEPEWTSSRAHLPRSHVVADPDSLSCPSAGLKARPLRRNILPNLLR